MLLKDKIASFLFGQKTEAPVEEEAIPDTKPEAEAPAEASAPPNPAMLELAPEHPLHQLYNLRRQEAGHLPAPRLCMDEDGVLPPEAVQKELGRLRAMLSTACGARLKECRGRNDPPKGKKQKEPEKAEKTEPEPLILDAQPCFLISADKLYAWLLVLPPVGEGKELSREQLQGALAEQGIRFGVDTRLVDQLSHNERRYFNLYLIAQGKPAFDGKNGNIVDSFPRVIQRVLEVDEYDQVDYTALNLIHNVEEGQEICHLIKPTEGEPGTSVLGDEIPAKSGKTVPLPKGRNTEISEDETQLLASISGSVEFTGHSFQVKPILEIPGDVDFSTGNLNFLGDINIKGNVLSGFTVRAMGNIHIGGVVEAGSTIEAGEDLVVVKGILGDGTTTVQAQRSVFSKYVENAIICVRENLQTDCILNSSIYCGSEVLVLSGRGSIIGGRICAGEKVQANVVGGLSECRTSIVLGGEPCFTFEREILQQKVLELEIELEELECQPDSPTKSSLLSKARIKMTTAEMKLRQMDESRKDQETEEKDKKKGRLECGIAYPGTRVHIGEEVFRFRQPSHSCIVTMVRDEIILM